ncbi:MAG: DUF433 domain-containing protein [Chloroflexota bacterium]
MTTLEKAEQLLTEMTPAEKVRLLHWLAHDLSGLVPGIEKTDGVVGGEPRIAGTRIPVWTLVQYRELGASEADLLRAYPTLQAEDLANAWVYYRLHQDEIEQQIQENEAA